MNWARKLALRLATALHLRGYDGGKVNTQNRFFQAKSQSENGIPWGEIQWLRWRSWELYRNNGRARKLVRSLESRVVGTGLQPEPQILKSNGEPHDEANKRCKAVFDRFCHKSDYLGAPGRGGQDFIGQCRTVLRSVILSGDVLSQNIPTNDDFPLRIKLIHGERLADGWAASVTAILPAGHYIFRGVEYDPDGKRVAYWIYPVHPGAQMDYRGFATLSNFEPSRVPIATNDILHVLMMEDVDHVRGVPWFAPILLDSRNVSDYTEDELRAAALSACVVAGYRLPTGANTLSGALPTGWDGTDGDGNRITTIPSGAFLNLGKDGAIEGFNPMRPNANAEGFAQFILRQIATGFPGTKASTLTGDYRNSSFSSERSAENDAWPEIETLQDWLCCSWCQPTYEAVVKTAILTGELSISGADPTTVMNTTWNGPVARSINPKDDEEASKLAIQNGTSSPQKESSMRGHKWRENVEETAAYCAYVIEKLSTAGVSEEVIDGMLSAMLGAKSAPKPPEPAGMQSAGAA